MCGKAYSVNAKFGGKTFGGQCSKLLVRRAPLLWIYVISRHRNAICIAMTRYNRCLNIETCKLC